MRGTSDRIMTLAQFLALVGGRVPLYLEIKSLGGSDRTLERRIAEALADYRGPVSVISFDPGSLIGDARIGAGDPARAHGHALLQGAEERARRRQPLPLDAHAGHRGRKA